MYCSITALLPLPLIVAIPFLETPHGRAHHLRHPIAKAGTFDTSQSVGCGSSIPRCYGTSARNRRGLRYSFESSILLSSIHAIHPCAQAQGVLAVVINPIGIVGSKNRHSYGSVPVARFARIERMKRKLFACLNLPKNSLQVTWRIIG